MATIIGVKFRTAQKIYYFDPDGIQFDEHDGVIVETIHGLEFGDVVLNNREVDENELVAPLKKVIRKATNSTSYCTTQWLFFYRSFICPGLCQGL